MTGTLRPDVPSDLLVLDAPSSVYVPYRFGENVVRTVLVGEAPVVDPEVDA